MCVYVLERPSAQTARQCLQLRINVQSSISATLSV